MCTSYSLAIPGDYRKKREKVRKKTMPCKISEKISNIKMAVEPINIGAMGLCLTICKGNSSNARLLGGVVYSDKKEYTPSFYSTILQPTGCCRVMKYLIAYSLGIF